MKKCKSVAQQQAEILMRMVEHIPSEPETVLGLFRRETSRKPQYFVAFVYPELLNNYPELELIVSFGTMHQEPDLLAIIGPTAPLIPWRLARHKPKEQPTWVKPLLRAEGSSV